MTIFFQNWDDQTQASSKGQNYRLFKSNISFEKYLVKISKPCYLRLLKFRTANHKLPTEIGRWDNTDIAERKCTKCNNHLVGDEFHYLFECDYFKAERKRYLNSYYYRRPNIIKFSQLLNSEDCKVLSKLSTFVDNIMKAFNWYKHRWNFCSHLYIIPCFLRVSVS